MTSYLLQVNIAITVFYVFYRLFLREKRYFGANRLYLNGALLLSFLLPALPSSGMSLIAGMHSVTTPVTEGIYPLYPVRPDPVELSAERVETAWGLGDWLLLVYAAGVLFLLGSFFYRLGKLA